MQAVQDQQVILVDEKDMPLGTMEKMEAHERGSLHRAFSVFIFNERGEMLLQRRSLQKYHSGGLWTNSCCSHPAPGEEVGRAAERRLDEEMGFSAKLEKLFDFVYRAEFHNGLVEHEFDHVFTGWHDGEVKYNEEEVMDYCYKNYEELRSWMDRNPEEFTEWFLLAFPRIESWWKAQFGI